jgi:hypothetical protein
MRLIDWMRANGVDDEAMADKVRESSKNEITCSEHAIKKWKYGERQPDAAVILRIQEITKNQVTLKDWVANPALEARRA